MAAIRNGLAESQSIADQLGQYQSPELLQKANIALTGHEEILELVEQALVAEPPYLARDGGFIAPGYDGDLDEARKLRDEGRSVIAGMQVEYAKQTGISTLKIKHNNVLGYFIETTATRRKNVCGTPVRDLHSSPDHRECRAVYHGTAFGNGNEDSERGQSGA